MKARAIFFRSLFALSIAALFAALPAAAGDAPALGLPNERHPWPGVAVGGQPTVEQLAAAKAAGYKTVVNLRPAAEIPELDEAAEARKLGFEYFYLPIAGPADFTEANAARLLALLRDEDKRPILLHCASGNRVGALVAVGSQKIEGKSAEEALALGKEAGITTAEPAVRQVLGLPPLPPPPPGKPEGG